MTRLRRFWLTWLALLEVVRLGVVIAWLIFGMLLFAPAARAEQVPVLAICKDGKLLAIQFIAPGPDVYTIPIPANACAQQKSAVKPPPPKKPAAST